MTASPIGHFEAETITRSHEFREQRLRRIFQLIESQRARSVRELAQQMHLSTAHLERMFKHETGMHVHDRIVEHRLQRAAHLLSSTDLSIKEIAHAVGYHHHSSFARAFQRRFAQPPRCYRLRDERAEQDCPEQTERAAAD